MTELRFTIPGKPSTAHRARSYVGDDGKMHHKKDRVFAAWKRHVANAARAARPLGWPCRPGLRYGVIVTGHMSEERIDADNLRGILDACEGILWPNDRQARPAAYDYEADAQPGREWVDVEVVAYDPRPNRCLVWLRVERRPEEGARA